MSTFLSLHKAKSLLFLLFPVLLQTGCSEAPVKENNRFKGTWKLDRYEAYDTTTKSWQADTVRKGYSGFILYDGEGHMGVQILPAGYNDFDAKRERDSLSTEELQAMIDYFHSNFVYFGNYNVSRDTVEHTIQSCTEPGNIGKVMRREFKFKGDTLLLTPIIPGINKSRLRWIKQK